jgi:hypothetical protein
MVYLVGVVTDVRDAGLTVNVGESRKCNVFVRIDEGTEWLCQRVWSGHRVKIAADATWRKQSDETYSLSFLAKRIEVK